MSFEILDIQNIAMIGDGFKYWFVFLVSFLEGLPVIGTLIPGGTLGIITGVLSGQGIMLPGVSLVTLVIGSFLGDVTGFYIGRFGHNIKFIRRFIDHEKLKSSMDAFDRKLFIIVVLGRLIPFVRSVPGLIAGARRVEPVRYVLYSLLGSLLWAGVAMVIGITLGETAGEMAIPISIAITILISAVAWITERMAKFKFI